MSVAVLDLGSNSFTLLVADVQGDGTLAQVLRDREAVRIGSSLGEDNRIDNDGWRRAMVSLAGLVARARRAGADRILAVATGALRDAENGTTFMEAAARQLDIDASVSAAGAAARLAYLGVRSELPSLFGRLAVVDIGGGSIEVAVGESDASLFDCSLPLGVQRLASMLEHEPLPGILKAVRAALAPAARAIRGFAPQRVVFASGTARAVHKLARKRCDVGVGHSWMDRAALQRVARWAESARPEALEEAGVRSDRLATIALSAFVVEMVAETLDVSELWLSKRGLREGVILEDLRREGGPLHASLDVGTQLPAEL